MAKGVDEEVPTPGSCVYYGVTPATGFLATITEPCISRYLERNSCVAAYTANTSFSGNVFTTNTGNGTSCCLIDFDYPRHFTILKEIW